MFFNACYYYLLWKVIIPHIHQNLYIVRNIKIFVILYHYSIFIKHNYILLLSNFDSVIIKTLLIELKMIRYQSSNDYYVWRKHF